MYTTCPRADDHGPLPTDTPLAETPADIGNQEAQIAPIRLQDGTAGLRRGLAARCTYVLVNDASVGKTVRPTKPSFCSLDLVYTVLPSCRLPCPLLPLPPGELFGPGPAQLWYCPVFGPATAPRDRLCRWPMGRSPTHDTGSASALGVCPWSDWWDASLCCRKIGSTNPSLA